VPKKNSKTTNGALPHADGAAAERAAARALALMAPVQDTAEEAFDAAAGAIALDPVLEKKLFHVRDHLKTIVHRETKADLQIMTFDPDVLTGQKFAGALIDELHVVAKNAKAPKRDPPGARRHAAVPGGVPRVHHHACRRRARRA
jgi:phage terminase large subunit-like protein